MASKIPPSVLQYQMEHIHETRQPGLIAFYAVMWTASILSVLLRLVSRKRKGLKLEADDYTVVLALVFLCGTFVCNFLYIAAGLGRHALANSPRQLALAVKLSFPSNILYTITWPLIKISILCLYRRIFFVVHRFKIFTEVFIGLLVCYIISTVLVDIFTCIPVQKAWIPTMEHGHCLDSTLLFKVTAGLNVAFDVVILISPMPLVWQLQATMRLKLGLSLIFLLGGLTCITSIMRIITFDQINLYDATWSYVDADYWTAAELCLSIICACLPTIRPLWRSLVDAYKNRSRSKNTTQSDNPPVSQERSKSFHMGWKSDFNPSPAPTYQPNSPSRYVSPTRRGFERLDEHIWPVGPNMDERAWIETNRTFQGSAGEKDIG